MVFQLVPVEVGLSRRASPSCLRYIGSMALEEAGAIDRYVAVLNASKVGLGLSMFARVWLIAQDAETIDHFMAAMKRLPQVVECYIMLGESDALLRVVVADLEDYRRLQAAQLTRRNGEARRSERLAKPTCRR